jgi:hypothetical protein
LNIRNVEKEKKKEKKNLSIAIIFQCESSSMRVGMRRSHEAKIARRILRSRMA